MSINVLHVNQAEKTGGAAIGIHRLHEGLLRQNIDSRLLVDILSTQDCKVSNIPPRRFIDWQIGRITRKLGFNEIHLTSTFDIDQHSFYKEADILHFHNLHNGYFNYLALPALTKTKPAILTLHDMWGMTGHCAYSFECDRWQSGCGHCPDLKTDPAIQRDSTALQWKLKRWAYHHSNLKAVVTTSSWMVEQVKHSMLNHLPIYQIPYCLDSSLYTPLDVEKCRLTLGISGYQHVLLCAAQSMKNPRKGGDLLIKALNCLPQQIQKQTVLLILGKGGDAIANEIDMASIDLGYVNSDRLKAIAYSAADLFLFPTRCDAFGLVAQEAMACETPTVAFDVGGVSDLVQHYQTGYLAKPESYEDFAQGINKLLKDKTQLKDIGNNCRNYVLENHSVDTISNLYIDIYKSCLNKQSMPL